MTRPVRLTRRGWRVLTATAYAAALLAGLTAETWNPWTNGTWTP
jgi:hypothetical protein